MQQVKRSATGVLVSTIRFCIFYDMALDHAGKEVSTFSRDFLSDGSLENSRFCKEISLILDNRSISNHCIEIVEAF